MCNKQRIVSYWFRMLKSQRFLSEIKDNVVIDIESEE